MLWSAQREEQYLSDFSVSAVRKSTNSRHRKPPLRGGTMRYRADITKQRRAASVLHFCNARATCCVRLVHAKCSRVMLSACALQQLSRTSTSRLQERLTSSRGLFCGNSEDRALFPRSSRIPFWDVFIEFFLRFGAFGSQKAQIFFAGLCPAPRWGSASDTPSRTHMSYPVRGRAPPEQQEHLNATSPARGALRGARRTHHSSAPSTSSRAPTAQHFRVPAATCPRIQETRQEHVVTFKRITLWHFSTRPRTTYAPWRCRSPPNLV